MSEKCLLDQWRDMAYDRELSKEQLEKFWGRYFSIERGIYDNGRISGWNQRQSESAESD